VDVSLVTVTRASGVGVAAFGAVVAAPVARDASVERAVPVGRLFASGVGVAAVVGPVLGTGWDACARLAALVGVADVAGVAVALALPPHAARRPLTLLITA